LGKRVVELTRLDRIAGRGEHGDHPVPRLLLGQAPHPGDPIGELVGCGGLRLRFRRDEVALQGTGQLGTQIVGLTRGERLGQHARNVAWTSVSVSSRGRPLRACTDETKVVVLHCSSSFARPYASDASQCSQPEGCRRGKPSADLPICARCPHTEAETG